MDKLQELTARLYNEGLAKGKEEGEALLEKARAEAATIVGKAREEAGRIISEARKESEDYSSKVESDLKMASRMSLQATRKDIEDLVITRITDEPVSKALSNEAFVKELITAVATRFSAEGSEDLSLVLPEKLRSSLEPFVQGQLSEILGKGVEASFSKRIGGGFTIGPKDGGYFISFTDETFRDLISEYLRPATKKLLFG